MTIAGYSGTAGEAGDHNLINGQKFSTKDNDNDMLTVLHTFKEHDGIRYVLILISMVHMVPAINLCSGTTGRIVMCPSSLVS